ncbi:MAG TPA: DNA-protecting protein DprA [Ruminococcaceae bacterium]|nr:DNA-protecting protein DprA [Oscillospiraceae bacterium]
MEFWIWLSNALGAGSPRINDIVACFETAEHFYAEKKTGFRHVEFLTAPEKQKLMDASLSDALRLKERTLDKGYRILTPDQKEYPNRLRNIYAMPAALYIDGTLAGLDDNVAITLVGARKCSDYGRTVAADLGRGLARMGAVVITGMARGIDGAAHEAALLAGGSTVAVLGCGLDIVYPPEHMTLRRETPKRGAVISEFPLGAKPEGFHFPIRNRLMSALSLGVVVVEGELSSGSLITANYALEQGKDVFAVPGSVLSGLSKGPFRLLQAGAIPVSCAGDILEEYRYRYAAKIDWRVPVEQNKREKPSAESRLKKADLAQPVVPIRKKRDLPPECDENIREIYEVLSEIPINADEIAARTQKNPAEVLTALSELEIMGYISANAGKRFCIC